MKPKFIKVPLQLQQSFSVRYDAVPYFFKELHFHPELELVHIHKGTGMQFVGNSLYRFKADDMILVGSDLPHLWKCDDPYFKPKSTLKAAATVVHFLPGIFGDVFLQMPENKIIESLFIKATAGILITKKTKKEIAIRMAELLNVAPAKRVLLLIEILHLLAASKDLKLLNDKGIVYDYSGRNNERMNNVLQFLFSHYNDTITLEEIAKIANMSTNAFCRYFKTSTKKTFSAFVLELRINHACKLLAETDKGIGVICYESGFSNFSNFNRYFKKATTLTPFQYRNKFMDSTTATIQ